MNEIHVTKEEFERLRKEAWDNRSNFELTDSDAADRSVVYKVIEDQDYPDQEDEG